MFLRSTHTRDDNRRFSSWLAAISCLQINEAITKWENGALPKRRLGISQASWNCQNPLAGARSLQAPAAALPFEQSSYDRLGKVWF